MTILFFFLVLHFIADFVLQTHWQAVNKSHDLEALARHAGSYTLAFLVGSLMILNTISIQTVAYFVVLNGAIHFWTDFVTSKITAKLWKEQKWHNFFMVIGFDQLLHFTAIFLTLKFIGVS